MTDKYTDSLKQLCWEVYYSGYTNGYGVEDAKPIHKRAARSQFEQFWERNK